MKKVILVLITVIIALQFSCKQKIKRGNIINEDKFVQVLTDIHMADATLIVKGFRIKADSVRVRKYYNDVLLEYNVTQKQIHDTFIYYTKNPRDFEKVYDKVSANIVKLEKEHFEDAKKRKEEKRDEIGKFKGKDKKS